LKRLVVNVGSLEKVTPVGIEISMAMAISMGVGMGIEIGDQNLIVWKPYMLIA